MNKLIMKLTDILYLKIKEIRNKRKVLTKTDTYLTFEEYVINYESSFYTTPTNYSKGKDFDGKLIDIKECCNIYDKLIIHIIKDDKIKKYIKYK